MKYDFVCPNCGANIVIEMSMKDYHADGHKCDKCGAELKRDPKSLASAMSIDETGDFYRKVN